MLETLNALNFGPHFIKWIQILYNNPKFRVKNNGFISKTYDMTRGIRQGSTLSALLFILTVETLAIRLKSSKEIHGFKIGKDKKVQHADDSTNTL